MITEHMKNNFSLVLNILCLVIAAAVMLTVMGGCAIFGGNTASGGDVSGGDVSAADAAEAPIASDADAIADEFIYTPKYQSIPPVWEPAEDDASYMAALRIRLDEYIQLFAALGGIMRDLPARCVTATEVRSDGAFLPFSGAMAQWVKLVEDYPADDLGEAAAAAHAVLREIAAATKEYMAAIPGLVEGGDMSRGDEYQNKIVDLLLQLEGMIAEV